MKIGIITDSVRQTSTGVGYYTKSICRHLTENSRINRYGIKYIDYEKNSFNKSRLIFIKNIFPFFRTYLWMITLPFQIRKLKLDFILNLSGGTHIFSFKQKEIFFIYDLSWRIYPKTHPLSRVILYSLLMGRVIKNSYKIITISESTKNDLIKYFEVPKDKIIVTYLGLPHYKKIISTNPIINGSYILYLGTLEPRKNISIIIESFYEINKSNTKYKLVIAGKKGWNYSNIFSLVKNLKLEKDVIFLGYVSDKEKINLYKYARLFVYPSLYEGFGIPVLEAMSFGCPVITSDTSSLPEVIGNAGIKIDPYSEQDLINAMLKVLNNEELRKKMITDGYNQAKKFTWEKTIEKLESTLN